ncbi:MAG: GNAT family N-acetyltransferase [Patescibacteria group bacterium]
MTKINYKKLSRKFPAKKLKFFFNESSPGKTLSQCQNIIDCSSVIIGAYDNKHLIGIGRSLDDKVYAFITDIIVNPDYRGKGIGSKRIENQNQNNSCPAALSACSFINFNKEGRPQVVTPNKRKSPQLGLFANCLRYAPATSFISKPLDEILKKYFCYFFGTIF